MQTVGTGWFPVWGCVREVLQCGGVDKFVKAGFPVVPVGVPCRACDAFGGVPEQDNLFVCFHHVEKSHSRALSFLLVCRIIVSG